MGMDWLQKMQYENKMKEVFEALGKEIQERNMKFDGDAEDKLFLERINASFGSHFKDFFFKDTGIMTDTMCTINIAFLKVDEAVTFILARMMNQGLIKEK